MNIFVFGINHKTAPIEIREQFYLNPLQQDVFLADLKSNPSIVEAFILSTCNRIEVYLHSIDQNFSIEEFICQVAQLKKITFQPQLKNHFYLYRDHDALVHLMRVVTGLDSLILGEKQILGQVKEAFERAQAKGFFLKSFNILANTTIRAGKKAQNETDINHGGSSVSWAAVTMAEKLLGDLGSKNILIIGAGEMSKLALEQISNKKFNKLYLMNRTKETAQSLVEKFGGEAVGFCDIKETLAHAHVCLCCTDAPHYILDLEIVEKVRPLNRGEQMLLIDISMPRNIDPRVSALTGVRLLDIDDLENIVEENMKKRHESVQHVENIIRDKIADFYSKLNRQSKDDALHKTK